MFNFCVCIRHPGFWSAHSQPVGTNHWDGGRRRHSGDSPQDDELSEAALHYDHGKPPASSAVTSSVQFRGEQFLSPCRTFTPDTEPRLIRMSLADLMRGQCYCFLWNLFSGTKLEYKSLCFSFRFILSLSSCKNCVVIDDQLNILPISSHMANIKPVPPKTQVPKLFGINFVCFSFGFCKTKISWEWVLTIKVNHINILMQMYLDFKWSQKLLW